MYKCMLMSVCLYEGVFECVSACVSAKCAGMSIHKTACAYVRIDEYLCARNCERASMCTLVLYHVFQTRFQGFSLVTGRNTFPCRSAVDKNVLSRSQLTSMSV